MAPGIPLDDSGMNQFKSEFGSFDRERAAKVNRLRQIRKKNLAFVTRLG
jgi:hypothetical protein